MAQLSGNSLSCSNSLVSNQLIIPLKMEFWTTPFPHFWSTERSGKQNHSLREATFLSMVFSNFTEYILNFKGKVEFPLFIIKCINVDFKADVYTPILNADLNAEKIHFNSSSNKTSFTFSCIYISRSACPIAAQMWRLCLSYCRWGLHDVAI